MIDLDKISDQHKREAIAGCFSDDNPLAEIILNELDLPIKYGKVSMKLPLSTKKIRWFVLKTIIKIHYIND